MGSPHPWTRSAALRAWLLGVMLGACLASSIGASASVPPGWQVSAPRRPLTLAQDAGLVARPWAWKLDPLARMSGPDPARSFEVQVRLAPGGRARLRLGSTERELTRSGPVRLEGDGIPVIEALSGRVELRDLTIDGRRQPGPLSPGVVAFSSVIGAALALGIRAAVTRAPGRARLRAGPLALPMGIGLWLSFQDPAAIAEALRVPALATPWLAAQVGLGGLMLMGSILIAWSQLRLDRRWHAVRALFALGVVWTALGAIFGLASIPGLLALGTTGMALGALILVNRSAARLPHFNAWSLLLCAAILFNLELTARSSAASSGWDAALDWNRAFARVSMPYMGASPGDFDDLEAGRHTSYPGRGYPVAFPPHGPRPRLVCLGGSSTGGAWMMDDLARFYPARLAGSLGPRLEVVNQGVGGWSSFHIRRYLEAQIDALAPDLVTLYIGHNDAVHGYPLPISQMYADWQRRGGQWQSRPALLTWALVLRGRPTGTSVAVPVAELEENLRAMIGQVYARGGRVLVMSEALAGPTPDLEPWRRAMARVADESERAEYLDVHATLGGRAGLFLDNVHLSDAGHAELASLMEQELARLGWLPAETAFP